MGRIVNRRNAVLGWAVWTFMRGRAKAKAEASLDATEGTPRRWGRRVVKLFAAALAAFGLLALWRKLRGGGDEDWVAPDPLDVTSTPAEPPPLASVEGDNDMPPAA